MSSNTAGRITAIIAHQGDVPINRLNSVIESLMQVFDERIAELEQARSRYQLRIVELERQLAEVTEERDDNFQAVLDITEKAKKEKRQNEIVANIFRKTE